MEERLQGFVFPFNAERVFSILHDETVQFATGFSIFRDSARCGGLVRIMISGGISDEDSVLEPSWGVESNKIHFYRSNPSVIVDCYELMPENKGVPAKMENVRILGDDFTEGTFNIF